MPVIQCSNKNCPHWDDTDQPDNCSHPVYMMKDCSKAMIKKDSPVKSKNWYQQQLLTDECHCSKPKRPRHSFCYSCYLSLPNDIQGELYQLIGKGYEETYEKAVAFLEAC